MRRSAHIITRELAAHAPFTGFGTGGPFFVDTDGAQPDPIEDDLALWMRTERGLVVVVGCSHAGLVNTLHHALRLSGETRLHAVLVQKTTLEGGGRGRRAHLDAVPSQAALPSENTTETGAPTDEPSPAAPPREAQPMAQQGDGAGRHVEECPAGASIDGRTTLIEAARICRVSIEQLTNQLGLPPGIDSREHLGRLKRRYGIDLHAVRRIACR